MASHLMVNYDLPWKPPTKDRRVRRFGETYRSRIWSKLKSVTWSVGTSSPRKPAREAKFITDC